MHDPKSEGLKQGSNEMEVGYVHKECQLQISQIGSPGSDGVVTCNNAMNAVVFSQRGAICQPQA